MVVFGQSGCILAEVVVFGQKQLYLGKIGCIWGKVVILLESGCIRSNVVVFGKKWLSSAFSWYSSKSGSVLEIVVVFE